MECMAKATSLLHHKFFISSYSKMTLQRKFCWTTPSPKDDQSHTSSHSTHWLLWSWIHLHTPQEDIQRTYSSGGTCFGHQKFLSEQPRPGPTPPSASIPLNAWHSLSIVWLITLWRSDNATANCISCFSRPYEPLPHFILLAQDFW